MSSEEQWLQRGVRPLPFEDEGVSDYFCPLQVLVDFRELILQI